MPQYLENVYGTLNLLMDEFLTHLPIFDLPTAYIMYVTETQICCKNPPKAFLPELQKEKISPVDTCDIIHVHQSAPQWCTCPLYMYVSSVLFLGCTHLLTPHGVGC